MGSRRTVAEGREEWERMNGGWRSHWLWLGGSKKGLGKTGTLGGGIEGSNWVK